MKKIEPPDQLADQKHALEKMRQDFVANVSHELRTPLTVIHGYLETLLEKPEQDPKALKTVYEQMYQQSVRMKQLVEDLLLLSRLESGMPEKSQQQSVTLAPLLKLICEQAKLLSGNRNHQFELALDKTFGA